MLKVQNDLLHVTCGDLAGFMVHCNQGAPVNPSEEPWALESGGSAKLFGSQVPVLLLSAYIFSAAFCGDGATKWPGEMIPDTVAYPTASPTMPSLLLQFRFSFV